MGKKILEVVTRVLAAKLEGSRQVAFRGYTNVPKGHAVYSSFSKTTIRDITNEINGLKTKDNLLFDANYETSFAPSEVKGLFWADDIVQNGEFSIDITGEGSKVGDMIDVDGKLYEVTKISDWKQFKTVFASVKLVEVEKVVEEAPKEEAKE